MRHGMHDLARHNGWATLQLLNFLGDQDETVLNWTVPGTFDAIGETLRHLIDAEMSYLFRLTGAWLERPWREGEAVGLDVLTERAVLLASVLESFLDRDWDSETLGQARGDGGEIYAVPAGIFLTQALHHANEHRAHICTILGAHGIEPPGVSGWDYSFDTGRSTLEAVATG